MDLFNVTYSYFSDAAGGRDTNTTVETREGVDSIINLVHNDALAYVVHSISAA